MELLWITYFLWRYTLTSSHPRRKSKRARKKFGQRKVKEESKSAWGQGCKRSDKFWLLIGIRKSLCFSAQSQSSNTRSRFVFSYTKYTYTPVARHKLTEGLLEEKSSKHNTKCKGNPQETRGKYAGPFAGIVMFAYLKDREFVYPMMSIDKFFGVSEFRSLSLSWTKWIFPLYFLLQLLCLKLFRS